MSWDDFSCEIDNNYIVGTGKSATTKVCSQWVEQILRRGEAKPGKPRVLLICPTGMAASVIGKQYEACPYLYYANILIGPCENFFVAYRIDIFTDVILLLQE